MSTPSRFKKDKEIIAEYESQVKGKRRGSRPRGSACGGRPGPVPVARTSWGGGAAGARRRSTFRRYRRGGNRRTPPAAIRRRETMVSRAPSPGCPHPALGIVVVRRVAQKE